MSFLNTRRAAAGDEGLTLIEMVVALFLVTLVLTSFVGVTIAGASSTRAAELRSRGTQVGNQEVELLKGAAWPTLGLYDSDTTLGGASVSATCTGSETVVSLGSVAPSPRVAPALQRIVTVSGRGYTVTDCVYWRDDPADGTAATGTETDSDGGKDVQHAVITVQWTLLGKVRTLVFDSVRTPTAVEVPPVPHATATLTLTAGSPSPSSQQLAADYSLSTAMTLTATTNIPASSVIATYNSFSGVPVPITLTSSDGGLTWSAVVPAGSSGGKFSPNPNTKFSFLASSGAGQANAASFANFSAPPTPFTVTGGATPSSVTLTSAGYLGSAVTLTATTTVVATSVSATYPLASGTGTVPLTTSNGLTWSATLAAGSSSGTFAATNNELFTFTGNAVSGSITGTAAITLTAYAAPNVIITSIYVEEYKSALLPYGRVCVKNSTSAPFAAQTLVVTATNVTVADTATVTWTSDNGSSVTYKVPAVLVSGVVTFKLVVPTSVKFTSTSSTFNVTVKRTSTDNVQATGSQAVPVLSTNGNGGFC